MSTVDLTALSGLELLHLARSDGNLPGVGRLVGIRLDEVEAGRVVAAMDTRPDFGNMMGTVHGGIVATLLDTVMACAVLSTLPAGVATTTLELKVNYVRPARTDGRTLTGEGTAIHSGRRTATAEGKVVDDQGKLIAHATTTCLILGPEG